MSRHHDNSEYMSSVMLFNKTVEVTHGKNKCPLSGKDAPVLDYKNIELLKTYITLGGRIIPSRITGVSRKRQRRLAQAIKRARILALLPFSAV